MHGLWFCRTWLKHRTSSALFLSNLMILWSMTIHHLFIAAAVLWSLYFLILFCVCFNFVLQSSRQQDQQWRSTCTCRGTWAKQHDTDWAIVCSCNNRWIAYNIFTHGFYMLATACALHIMIHLNDYSLFSPLFEHSWFFSVHFDLNLQFIISWYSLPENNIGDEGACALAEALKHNTTLIEL